jgi:hypothetical protein
MTSTRTAASSRRGAVAVRFTADEAPVRAWLREHAAATGESVNALIRRAVRELMDRTNLEDPVMTTAPPRPDEAGSDQLPPELLRGFRAPAAGLDYSPAAGLADMRPPLNGCAEQAEIGPDRFLLRCWWLPDQHAGDVHFDARYRIEWRNSVLPAEHAAELLRPKRLCVRCRQDVPDAEWAALFGGWLCDPCAMDWARHLASLDPAARHRIFSELLADAASGVLAAGPIAPPIPPRVPPYAAAGGSDGSH